MTAGEPGSEWLSEVAYLAGYAFELPLRDALNNSELDPTRRALAVLGMGTNLDFGHLAAGELLGAVRLIRDDRAAEVPSGQGRDATLLRDILDTTGDDYQRSLWYAVSRREIDVAAGHLTWLVATMYGRGAMFRAIRDAKVAMPLLPRSPLPAASCQLPAASCRARRRAAHLWLSRRACPAAPAGREDRARGPSACIPPMLRIAGALAGSVKSKARPPRHESARAVAPA